MTGKRAKAPKVERPRIGAPTKCDEVLTALVVKRIGEGAPVNVAAQAEGIAPPTMTAWRAKAAEGREPYRTFVNEVAQARARFVAARVNNIVNAGFAAGDEDGPSGGDWKADAFILERTDPENFSAQQTVMLKAEENVSAELLSLLRGALSASAWAEVVAALRRGDDEAEHVEH